ncbi:NUDIX domain-containing protein [Agromyces seonyuensis]|uniref:NUDIX domain-containing protein n=1 Tax=Agromyces seonyuensis TaxID=2662446 RepID=A0A6I4P7S5_9MICO|nr:NUDIX domain-containing protein [Agromyces seonyuensis]
MSDAPTAPLADEAVEVEVRSSELLVEGRVWDVRRDVFAYGDAELVRDYVDHTGAVAVLALDDDGRVLLIQQYRHPVRARDWEIPAGLLDVPGEDPVEAAKRELAEEVDLAADEWHVLADFFTSPGGSDESLRVFLARGLTAIEHDYVREGEEADIVRRWVDLDEVVDAVLARRVQNPALVTAALAAHVARERDWSTLAPADATWPFRSTPRRG